MTCLLSMVSGKALRPLMGDRCFVHPHGQAVEPNCRGRGRAGRIWRGRKEQNEGRGVEEVEEENACGMGR